jgi:glycosyl-4,4'-diaponeurosporenoate acyltransferase
MADGTVRLVLIDAAAWAGLSVAVGYGGHRVAARHLGHDTWLTRLRRFEDGGRRWERLGIRRWKDRLPEAGGLFTGGVSKRRLGGDADLERFVVETRRAEIVHWGLAACGPLFLLWNPLWLGGVMAAFGIGFNAPFIVVQRYNRGRVQRALARRQATRRAGPER